jgi:RNA polymerase sigma-70 factor (ECF subfamily)
MVDESELIQAAQHGDREAFDELVRRTYVDLFTLAVRLTGNEEDARDVVQDAYLRAWKGIGKFRGDAQLSTWLYRITANCASTHLSRRRRTRTEPLLPGFEPADVRHDAQPEAMTETHLDLAQVAQAVDELPA